MEVHNIHDLHGKVNLKKGDFAQVVHFSPMGSVAYLNLVLKMCLSLVAIHWQKIEGSSFLPECQQMAAFHWYDFWRNKS